SGLLTVMFQRVRLEKPGQVDPRAAEFTLSLLAAMYDRLYQNYTTKNYTIRIATAALLALSGDTLLAKYRDEKSFFHLYAAPGGKVALITCSALRSLLTDLNQMPSIVGESCTPSCVETTTNSCFREVSLDSAIVEEKFMSWLRSDAACLLWLPPCYRFSVTEMVSHQTRCR
ncbi:DYTN protein, partial [Upupa epops]|nr:DYTN protein [Upupa epops]